VPVWDLPVPVTTRKADEMTFSRRGLASLISGTCVIVAGVTLFSALPASSVGASGPLATKAGTTWSQGNTQVVPLSGPPNNFVPIDTTPTLPAGSYTYTFVINVSDVSAGAVVLCGEAQSISAQVTGDYGVVDNSGGSAAIGGTCVQSGSIKLTSPATMDFWATVYSGSVGGAAVTKWSMTETKVPSVTFSS
jgi:hypothetical protein